MTRSVGVNVEPPHGLRVHQIDRHDQKLFAAQEVDVEPFAFPTGQDGQVERGPRSAVGAFDHCGYLLDHKSCILQVGAVRDDLPTELEGVGYDLTQVADLNRDLGHRSSVRVFYRRLCNRVADGEFVHRWHPPRSITVRSETRSLLRHLLEGPQIRAALTGDAASRGRRNRNRWHRVHGTRPHVTDRDAANDAGRAMPKMASKDGGGQSRIP